MDGRFAVALLALAGSAAAGAAPARPAQRPGEAVVVRAIVADLRGGAERASAAQVRRGLKAVDIDGDGRADYLFAKEKLGSGWCGSGGCWIQLWLDRSPGRPLKIFDGQVRETTFRRAGRARIVDFDLHGSVCWTFGVHPCPASFRWDRALGRLVETATPGGRGIVRYLAPTEGIDGAPPAAVSAALDAAAAACTKRGGKAADTGAITVPDVDGDGRRDWVIPELSCEMPDGQAFEAPPMALFATAGNAGAPVLAASAPRLEIDAAATPAAVAAVDLASCAPDAMEPENCRRTKLVWSAPARRFVPGHPPAAKAR